MEQLKGILFIFNKFHINILLFILLIFSAIAIKYLTIKFYKSLKIILSNNDNIALIKKLYVLYNVVVFLFILFSILLPSLYFIIYIHIIL